MSRFMNEYEIDDAARRYHQHPILGPAVATLANLARWSNSNSDGWPYFQKPLRAASRLMELIERDGTAKYACDREREDVTIAEYKKALQPIRAFRTRAGADFDIVDAA